jgi:predicted transposase YbfD/YdcC
METRISRILQGFEEIEDPRINRHKMYPLEEILLLVLCASICGCETYEDIALFGEFKLEILRRWAPFKEGIPTKSTIARVLSLLDPEEFKTSFLKWFQTMQSVTEEKSTIAIDGKTLRRSFDKAAGKSAIHMVSAFATESKLVLGQTKVDSKSNEIKAIPKLLDSLSLENCIVDLYSSDLPK